MEEKPIVVARVRIQNAKNKIMQATFYTVEVGSYQFLIDDMKLTSVIQTRTSRKNFAQLDNSMCSSCMSIEHSMYLPHN